jgi:rhodanese-related sulfurtransferase
LVVLLLSLLLCLAATALRPQGLHFFLKDARRSAMPANDHAGIAISLDRALQYERSGGVLFADARDLHDYLAGHIAGARSLPLNRFDEWINDFLAATDAETVIIAYCGGGHCPLAGELAERLVFVGFNNVYYLIDGWGEWRARGLPVAAGQEPPLQ